MTLPELHTAQRIQQILTAIPLAVLTLVSYPAAAQSVAQPTPFEDRIPGSGCTSPDSVAWIVGVWETTGGQTVFNERWVRLSAGTFEGAGQVLDADSREVRSEESLRLVGMGSGLFYLAKVEHNELPTAFAATDCSRTRVVFENDAHDFPKRIVYRLVDADHLTVDVDDGNGQGFSLAFERVK